jgi:predicted cupin superfamily sugar epimerase
MNRDRARYFTRRRHGVLTAERVIEILGLQPLSPEGGYYKETYRSDETVAGEALPSRYGGDRVLGAAIYFLVTPHVFSAVHRLSTDEVYHFYLGDPADLVELHPDGSSKIVRLGQNILADMTLQHVVKRGVWQGIRLAAGGRFALLGTTTAPGFDGADYEHGERDALLAAYPEARDLVLALTR